MTVLSFSASQVGKASVVRLFHSSFGKNYTLDKKDYTGESSVENTLLKHFDFDEKAFSFPP